MELTEQDIQSIVQSGEGYNAEFKISIPSKVKELAGEVCAFANAAGAIYVRQGSNSQKITSVEQMRDFFQQSGRIYFDEGSCNGFSYENDFDIEFFKEFRIIAGFSPATDNEQIIRNLQLLNNDNVFKNGGVLFFGKQPESFFNKAVIRCVAFEGTDKVQIIDDKIWGGPLMQQYRETLRWLKTKLSVRYIIEGSGPRKEVWEIPETAFKEAIINALSHRDYYDKGGRTMIELFDDRVEITNPGGLVSAILPEEFGTKSSLKSSLKILELISKNERITTNEMAEVLNISRRAITKQLSKLKEEGSLKRIGSRKAGKWLILKKK